MFLSLFLFIVAANSAQPRTSVEEAELHWSICEESVQDIETKLNLDLSTPKQRDLIYYDKAGSPFFKQGLILRVREKADSFKSVIKLRGLEENKIDWTWLLLREHKCEWDQFGNEKKLSCSIPNQGIPGEPLFSSEQKEFVARMGPTVNYRDLFPRGPFRNFEIEFRKNSYEFSLEFVDLSKRFIFEISTRVATVDANSIYRQVTNDFKSRHLVLCKQQRGLSSQLLDPHP